MTAALVRIGRHLLGRAAACLYAATHQVVADQLCTVEIADVVGQLAASAEDEVQLLAALRDRFDQIYGEHADTLTAWQHEQLADAAAVLHAALDSADCHRIRLQAATAAVHEAGFHV